MPDENLLGEENKGFYLIMANFQWERLLMALGAVGSMERLLERDVEYATGARRPSAARSANFQAIRHKLAEMALQARGARARSPTTRLRLFADGHDAISEVDDGEARTTQRAAFEVADDALQIHGGAGYMKEYGIERAARDLRLGPIGGGTDEIMKEILGQAAGAVGVSPRRRRGAARSNLGTER